MKVHLLVLFGIPGSGKSTMAKRLLQRSTNIIPYPKVIVIEGDDALSHILETKSCSVPLADQKNPKSLNAFFSPEAYREARRLFVKRIEDTLNKCTCQPSNSSDTADSEYLIIAVDNLPLCSMRLELWRLVRDLNEISMAEKGVLCSFSQLLLDTPLTECLARNERRKQTLSEVDGDDEISRNSSDPLQLDPYVPPSVIITMDATMDRGNITTRKTNCCYDPPPLLVIQETTQGENMDTIVHFILGNASKTSSPHYPLRATQKETIECACDTPPQPFIHQLDVALRKVVNTIMKTLPPSLPIHLKNELAKRLSAEKKMILQGSSGTDDIEHQTDADAATLKAETLSMSLFAVVDFLCRLECPQ